MTEGYIFTLCVNPHLGGGGGYPVSVKGKIFDTRFGLIHVQTGKKKFCPGTPHHRKREKILTPDLAWYMFRLEKNFFVEGPPPPPLVKGKNFDTRFGLIHVQTEKNKFCQGTPPPPPVKGKIFDTRFGLIHVQTGKKNFVEGPPPPTREGKKFWHQIWLDTCSDWQKKIFLSRDLPPTPTGKGKNFWHQIWLDTCSDWKKKFFCQGTPPSPPPHQ